MAAMTHLSFTLFDRSAHQPDILSKTDDFSELTITDLAHRAVESWPGLWQMDMLKNMRGLNAMKKKRMSIIMILLAGAAAICISCDNGGSDDGITNWVKAYGTAAGDEAYPHKIIPTVDGGFVMLGDANDIVKLNGEGAVLWQKRFATGQEGLKLMALGETAEGDLVVAGQGTYSSDVLIKLDSGGNELWEKSNDWQGSLSWCAIDVDKSTGAIYTLYVWDEFSVVMKKDAAGDTLWCKKINIHYGRPYFSIRATSDGGCIMAESVYFPSSTGDSPGTSLSFAIKMTGSGAVEWQKTYGPSGGIKDLEYGENYDGFVSVEQAQDGGYVLAGESQWGNTVWILRIDASGNKLWAKEISSIIRSNSNAYTTSVPIAAYPLADGGYVFAGTSEYDCGSIFTATERIDQAAWIIKLSSSGAMVWQKNYREKTFTYTTTWEYYYLLTSGEITVKVTKNLMDLRAFAPVSGGGFVGAGSTKMYGTGGYDYMVLKMNGSGAVTDTELEMSTRKATVTNLTFTVKDEIVEVTDHAIGAFPLPGLTITGSGYLATDI